MKKMLSLFAAAAVVAAGAAAFAGGDCGSGAEGSSGFSCQNMCPLAKQANERRAYGTEGSTVRLQALAAQVQKSLARV
jgi:hypothetical protein